MRIRKGRTRRYSHDKLISWTQNRCKECGRFLNRNEFEYCSVHRIVRNRKEYMHEYYKKVSICT